MSLKWQNNPALEYSRSCIGNLVKVTNKQEYGIMENFWNINEMLETKWIFNDKQNSLSLVEWGSGGGGERGGGGEVVPFLASGIWEP